MLPNVPVGSIIAWVLRVDNDTSGEAVDLPDGWLRCDGSVIPEGSIWAGKQVPDLNGQRRFLRGGSEEEMLTLEDDQIMEHTHEINDAQHSHSYEDKHYTHDYEGYGPNTHNTYWDNFLYQDHRTTSGNTPGITIEGVTGDYSHGDENRPKNMGIIWIIRVW